MKLKSVKIIDSIYYNLWFIPAIMVLITILLGGLILHFESYIKFVDLEDYFGRYINAQGLQSFFATTASASITITSVTFSITVLTLSIASNHLGARLVPNFIRHKITQTFLGFLISTFVFSLFVLQSHSTLQVHLSSLYLAAIICVILIIISIFLFIFFINFICKMIQLDNILEFLLDDLMRCINRFILESDKSFQNTSIDNRITFRESQSVNFDSIKYQKFFINCKSYGYVQWIDYNKLFELSEKHNIIIKTIAKVGDFIINNSTVFQVYFNEDLNEEQKSFISTKCLQSINMGHRRVSVHDIEFLFEELSEIALIALSPSVNNPYTARHCIDRFIQGLNTLSNYKLPRNILCNSKGEIKVIRNVIKIQDIINSSFNRLRQQIKYDAFISLHTFKRIHNLLRTNVRDEIVKALKKQTDILYDDILKQDYNIEDLELIKKEYQIIKNF